MDVKEIECICGKICKDWQEYVDCLITHGELNEEICDEEMD